MSRVIPAQPQFYCKYTYCFKSTQCHESYLHNHSSTVSLRIVLSQCNASCSTCTTTVLLSFYIIVLNQCHVSYLHNDRSAVVLHQLPVAVDNETESFLAAVEKVLGVTVDVEADQVTPEHPYQDLIIPRDEPEHVPGRKRDVKEEGDLEPPQSLLVGHLTQASRGEHEVIVVDPDEDRLRRVVRRHCRGRRLCELAVDERVRLPVFPFKHGSVGHRVEHRPQRRVAASVVIFIEHVRVDIHRPDLAAFQSLSGIIRRGIALGNRLVDAEMHAGPADPYSVAVTHDRRHGCDEATGRRVTCESPVFVVLQHEWQAIGDDNHGHVFRPAAVVIILCCE